MASAVFSGVRGTERSNDLTRLFSDIGARRQVLRVGPRCVLEYEFRGFSRIIGLKTRNIDAEAPAPAITSIRG